MTNEEIQKAKESFLRMGVAEGSIFSEIMRARYLDYNLLSIQWLFPAMGMIRFLREVSI